MDSEAASAGLPLPPRTLKMDSGLPSAQEPAGQTLQTTALVHEAYLRLFADKPTGWSGRGHFFAAAAEAMRRILVERALERHTRERGGGRRKLSLDVVELFIDPEPQALLALNEALTRLENQDRRMSDVVEVRWPDGVRECFGEFEAGQTVVLERGKGSGVKAGG